MKKHLRIFAVAIVTIMLALTLVSCGGPNADPDKALEALKENGVEWVVKDTTIIPGLLKIAGVSGVDTVLSGTDKIDGEYAHITVVYFKESDDAKDAYEKIEELADDDKGDAKDSDWVFERSGKMIYWGTKNAVKAAR